MIDVTGLDPLCLGELGGGVQCYGEFGAFGRARTMKIGRGLKGEEKIRKIEVFLTYEWLIGSL